MAVTKCGDCDWPKAGLMRVTKKMGTVTVFEGNLCATCWLIRQYKAIGMKKEAKEVEKQRKEWKK